MSLLTSLTAFWNLQEASGNASDALGVETLTDTNTVTQNPGPSPASVPQARQFTKANDEKLVRADNAQLSAGDIDLTLAGWLRLDTNAPSATVVVTKNTGAAWEYEVYYSVGNGLRLYLENGASSIDVLASIGDLAVNTWYFFVAWHDSVANTLNIQVNDGATTSTAYSGGIADTTGEFGIGGNVPSGSQFDGRIAAIGLWKRILTPVERSELYNNGKGLLHPFTGSQGLVIGSELGFVGEGMVGEPDLETGPEPQTITDLLGLLDSHVRDYDRPLTDALGLLDSRLSDLSRPHSDSLGLLDSHVLDLSRPLTDLLGLLDSQVQVYTGDHTVTDPLGLLDSRDQAWVGLLEVTDLLGLLDDITGLISLEQVITDLLGLTDSTTSLVDAVRDVTDALGLTDERLGLLERPLTDVLGLLDSQVMAQARELSDLLGLLDSASWTLDYVQTVTDALGLLDSLERAQDYVRTLADLLGLLDSRELARARELTDLLGLLDSHVKLLVTGDGLGGPFPIMPSTGVGSSLGGGRLRMREMPLRQAPLRRPPLRQPPRRQ